MESPIILQIVVIVCFIGIIAILFLEDQDYLTYSVVFVLIIGLATTLLGGFESEEEAFGIILAVDFEVIVFLICLFSIVEILNDKKVFHQIAVKIINRYAFHPRRLFYAICITSTMIATVIEDLSVAIIFIPIVIAACKGIKISPVPYMFGVTICINLASTLTPFGSAENIIIANHFNLSLHWYLVHLGAYFLIVLALTLVLLDKILLSKYLREYYNDIYMALPGYYDYERLAPEPSIKVDPTQMDEWTGQSEPKQNSKRPLVETRQPPSIEDHRLSDEFLKNARLKDLKFRVLQAKEYAESNGHAAGPDVKVVVNGATMESLLQQMEMAQNPNILSKNHVGPSCAVGESVNILAIDIDKREYHRNLIGLAAFTAILVTITNIVVAGLLGLILFTALNPITNEKGRKIPSISHYLKRIDAKLIYFFVILFITVYFMELAGITLWIDEMVERWGHHDTFLIAVGVMVITSLLSGFLDDAPITIMFLPIIQNLFTSFNHPGNPLFLAFTLGINLGGNFLPQGAACDMMTLELARKHRVKGFTYKSLTIVGGIFALLHILLGIAYIAIYMAILGL